MATGTIEQTIGTAIWDNTNNKGYVKFANGAMIQWGTATFSTLSSGVVSTTVTLPVAFKDASFRVALTPSRNGLNYITTPVYDSNTGGNITHTTNTFDAVAKASNANCGFNYVAIGLWK